MSWADRAARARLLADRYPASSELLRFYAELALWQQQAAPRASAPEAAAALFPELVALLERCAPRPLAETARVTDGDRIAAIVGEAIEGRDLAVSDDFFARALLQPWAAERSAGACPWCASAPVAGALLPAGEGLRLDLVCALCFGRRPFPRGRCAGCGAEGEALASYAAADFAHLALVACERCKRCLTTVDLARDAGAIPEVDELAGLALAVWAHDRGYTKLRRNIAGI